MTNIPGWSCHCSPGTPCPGAPQYHGQHPRQEPGTRLALHLTASPGIRGIPKAQWDTGGPVTTSPGLWGRAAAHQLYPALPFSMKQLKPSSLFTRKQRGKQWDPALSLSSIQPGTFPRFSCADPVLPHPTPCQGLLACAQPVQNQPQGNSMALKHARNFTQAFGFLLVPRALPHRAGFVRQVKTQLLELLTLKRECFPAPFPENHLFPAAEPQMSV